MTDDAGARQLKSRENVLRQIAARRGLVLHKRRRRDPLAPDFGLWQIKNADGSVLASVYSVDDVAEELERVARERAELPSQRTSP